jgi:hypothetical protein
MRLIAAVLVSLVWLTQTHAQTKENAPSIISTRLQELAHSSPLAERLGIKWESATAEDIGRYMGMLASTQVIAARVANESGREPADADYLAALAAQCLFPPNKPAFVEKFWPTLQASFSRDDVRASIWEAVGPQTLELSTMLFAANNQNDWVAAMASDKNFPSTPEEYYRYVFDVNKLVRRE